MLITWQESLLVGFEPIDREHGVLVSLINQLYDEVKEGADRKTIDETVFALADQVAAHFNHEDELMRANAYPDRSNHLLEHRKLIDQLDTLLDGMDLLTDQTLVDAIRFMDQWFTDHVINSDARLGGFLQKDAVSHAGVPAGAAGRTQ